MERLQKVVKGRGVTPGCGEGKALITKQAFMFSHGVDPQSGEVIDVHSDILRENIKGKVLIFPFGKGSTTGSAWFLETIRQGNGPSAIINKETEPIIASAIIIARLLYRIDIPLVDRLEEDITDIVKRDELIQVDGDKGEIRIYCPK